jgi:hypothetical protein
MNKFAPPILAAALALLCASCAAQPVQNDPFQTFYSPTGYGDRAALTDSKVTPPVDYQVVTTNGNSNRIAVTLVEQGYIPIGTSNFQSPWGEPHREAAAEMGRKVGASLVTSSGCRVGYRPSSDPDATREHLGVTAVGKHA